MDLFSSNGTPKPRNHIDCSINDGTQLLLLLLSNIYCKSVLTGECLGRCTSQWKNSNRKPQNKMTDCVTNQTASPLNGPIVW
mmetsp:Transcript_27849/g.75776  ORF Transcript_27849/g.75776 Transcript_27849/m.75776 type:complete len:82 (-) Transcript_27849:290-535(-)